MPASPSASATGPDTGGTTTLLRSRQGGSCRFLNQTVKLRRRDVSLGPDPEDPQAVRFGELLPTTNKCFANRESLAGINQ